MEPEPPLMEEEGICSEMNISSWYRLEVQERTCSPWWLNQLKARKAGDSSKAQVYSKRMLLLVIKRKKNSTAGKL